MRIKTIKIKKRIELSDEKYREMKGLIIAVALLTAGMIIGAGAVKNGYAESITEIFDVYSTARLSQKMHETFFNSLFVNLSFLAVSFMAGISCMGLPVTIILPFFRGVGLGITAGYMYTKYAMSGIGYYLLTIFPGSIPAVTSFIASTNFSTFMSIYILSVIMGKREYEQGSLIKYIKTFSVITAVTFLSSLIDCILTKSFTYLFSF